MDAWGQILREHGACDAAPWLLHRVEWFRCCRLRVLIRGDLRRRLRPHDREEIGPRMLARTAK